jgi:pyrimidine-specific ribonucleoside hydrolase
MTNLAILLKAFPDIKNRIFGITIMGGAIGLGNWSAAAEFNILVDPEAASIVFSQGLPLTMVPLEVTHTVAVTE